MNPNDGYLIGTLLAITILVVVATWWFSHRHRQRRNDRVVHVATAARLVDAVHMRGRIVLVSGGTFGAEVGGFFLEMLARCGLDAAVGSILLAEFDSYRRDRFRARVGDIYGDRLVFPTSTRMQAGFHSADLPWIKRKQFRWMPALRDAAREVCQLHQRLTGSDPGLIIVIGGAGATSFATTAAVHVLTRTFPDALCVAVCHYPTDEYWRARTPAIIKAYGLAGVIGMIVCDSLEDDSAPDRSPVTNDLGTVLALVGLLAASAVDDQGAEMNNLMQAILRGGDGDDVRLASFKFVSADIPAWPTGSWLRRRVAPTQYVVSREMAVETAKDLLAEVHHAEHAAVTADFGTPDSTQVTIVAIPIAPDDLVTLKDEVEEAQRLVPGVRRGQRLVFVPIVTVLDARAPTCPLHVITLDALATQGHPIVIVEEVPMPRLAFMPSVGNGRVSTSAHPALPAGDTEHAERRPRSSSAASERRAAFRRLVDAEPNLAPAAMRDRLGLPWSTFYRDRDTLGLHWNDETHTWEVPNESA